MGNRAVFLDRDGVITKRRIDYVKRVREMEIIPGAAEALRELLPLKVKIIVITNQSAINRGLTTHAEVAKIHGRMLKHLSSRGCKIDAVYYCPHRPDEHCDCRKPAIGLMISAANDHDLDLTRSWFIGDGASDMLAAERAGCSFVHVETNKTGELEQAVSRIARESKKDESGQRFE